MRLGGGMADTTDLKSVDRKVVRVRVPPQALFFSNRYVWPRRNPGRAPR
jgi:hypothetical protein